MLNMVHIGKGWQQRLSKDSSMSIALGLLIMNVFQASLVWTILGFLACMYVIIRHLKRVPEAVITDRLIVALLLVSMFMFVGFSALTQDILPFEQSLLFTLFIPILFIAFSVMKYLGIISMTHIYRTILLSVGMIAFMSLFATVAMYGPFYRLLYEGKVLYYEGEQYVISSEMQLWNGWGWMTASPSSLYGHWAILLSPIATFRLSSYRAWIRQPWHSVPVLLAVVSMLIWTDATTLMYAAGILGIMMVVSLFRKYVVAKIAQQAIVISLSSLLLIGVFLGFADAFGWFGLDDWIRSITLLNRVYNGSFVDRYQALLVAMSQSMFSQYGNVIIQNTFLYETGSFWFDLGYQGGLLSFITYGLMLMVTFNMVIKTNQREQTPTFWSIVFAFGLLHLVWLFHFDTFPYRREMNEWTPMLIIQHPLVVVTTIFLAMIAIDPFMGWGKTTPNVHSEKELHKEKSLSSLQVQQKEQDSQSYNESEKQSHP